jgi:hypothetical protein
LNHHEFSFRLSRAQDLPKRSTLKILPMSAAWLPAAPALATSNYNAHQKSGQDAAPHPGQAAFVLKITASLARPVRAHKKI